MGSGKVVFSGGKVTSDFSGNDDATFDGRKAKPSPTKTEGSKSITPDESSKSEPPKEMKPTRDRLSPKQATILEPQKQLTDQEKKEIIAQHQEEIAESKLAQKKADAIYEEHESNSAYQDKTFATTADGEPVTMSGWDGKTNPPAPPECSRVTPERVLEHSENLRPPHPVQRHANDHGVPGRWNACHAEKQLSLLTDTPKPIGVSRDMCKNCQGYFQRQAMTSGKAYVVSDPVKTRIFMPDGNIVEA